MTRTHDQCILFFVKHPEPGQVLTRLGADIGMDAAARLQHAFARDMIANLKWVEETDLIVCFAPKEREAEVREWLPEAGQYWAQRGRDLASRMKNAFRQALKAGYARMVLVGSDLPDLDEEEVRRALGQLDYNTACLGPAEDGGYWLIGFHERCFTPEMFDSVDFDRDDVFAQSVRRLDFDDRNYVTLATWRDVDTIDDLRAFVARNADKRFAQRQSWRLADTFL